MMDLDRSKIHAFAVPSDLGRWLADNHATESEIWVRIFSKSSQTPSVTWEECVVEALAWGWIDGLKKPFGGGSFLQRLTPRRAASPWSKRNRVHVERLIAAGRMQPPGLAAVEAARRDGRWDRAYASASEMRIPDDLLAALEINPAAHAFYRTLDRKNLYSIYYRLQAAKRPETRRKRMEAFIAMLARGERLH